jgi:hypothetical protein
LNWKDSVAVDVILQPILNCYYDDLLLSRDVNKRWRMVNDL